MEQSARQSMKIAGSGTFSGGNYSEVAISGSGSGTGDVDCLTFKVSGSAKINGKLKAEVVKISGSATVTDDIQADEIRISGAITLGSDANVKTMKVSGGSEIEGNLTADQIKISGAIKVKGDVNAETFAASGGFEIGGLLNAGSVDVSLYGVSHAREIGGENITIRKEPHNKVIRFLQSLLPHVTTLKVDTIEGDNIYLEYTRAKIVRGSNVKIGQGCQIELVEYKDTFEEDSHGGVKENRRI